MVPSSTVFEMYPLGFLTIASYLHDRGMDVRIVNLALRMMNDRHFDVPAFLARQRPRAVGIDLHWLPHAHGALEVARLVKEVPSRRAGNLRRLSSSYFHEELIGYPQVDFVLRGDSTEPPLHELLVALRRGSPLDQIPNLTWKDGGNVRVNPHTYVPASLDYVDIRPDRVIEMMVRHRDFEGPLPFRGWWRNPIAAVFTVKGCAYECVTCGSSHTTCTHLTKRQRPVFRSPASLIANVEAFARLTRGPIAADRRPAHGGRGPCQRGPRAAARQRRRERNHHRAVRRAPPGFLHEIDRCVPHWSIEFSPRATSRRFAMRRRRGGLHDGTNGGDARRSAAAALRAPRRVFHDRPAGPDTGVGARDRGVLRAPVPALRQTPVVLHLTDGAVHRPGSRGFEEPERFGYRLFARTLEEHRQLLVQPTWERILNYETKWMTRRELVDATYDAAERLNELKIRYGRIPPRRGCKVAANIAAARALRARLEALLAQGGDPADDPALRGEISEFSMSTVWRQARAVLAARVVALPD